MGPIIPLGSTRFARVFPFPWKPWKSLGSPRRARRGAKLLLRVPPHCLLSSRSHSGAQRGEHGKIEERGGEFHVEITVTMGEHAHVFEFDCGDKYVTAAGKGLVRMRGNFEHLKKDQVSALGSLVTDFVGDMGLILLREKR
jgi:hypothetical protein